MLTIGEFSRLSQTTVKTLRFYEARGLFRPAFVDPGSGYRYYSADQVTELGRVLHLRALGFSLRQIRDAMRDGSRLRAMLVDKRGELEQRLRDEHARLAGVDGWLDQLERSAVPSDAVTLKSVGAQHVASIRRSIARYADAVELFEELDACTNRGRRGAPLAAMWHTCGALGRPIDCEAYVPVRHAVASNRRINVIDMPPTMMASIVCRGDARASAESYTTIRSWIAANGFKISGPKRELYWRGGLDRDRDTDITEIQFPISHHAGAGEARPR